MKFEPRRLQ